MDPVTITAVVTAVASVINNFIGRQRQGRKLDQVVASTTTNHGKLMGQHIEHIVDAVGRIENSQAVLVSRVDDIAVRVDRLERPRRTEPLVAAAA